MPPRPAKPKPDATPRERLRFRRWLALYLQRRRKLRQQKQGEG